MRKVVKLRFLYLYWPSLDHLSVLYQCALERDLGLFAAGDETEVGEKGLTLSGGQKVGYFLCSMITSDQGA
jgi:hypothetical protein